VVSGGTDAPAGSAAAALGVGVERDRARIAAGERPLYHVASATSNDGSVNVTIRELPLIHLYVPDAAGVRDGARLLVARTLGVDPRSFDLRDDPPAD
jgi:hypothetical protein